MYTEVAQNHLKDISILTYLRSNDIFLSGTIWGDGNSEWGTKTKVFENHLKHIYVRTTLTKMSTQRVSYFFNCPQINPRSINPNDHRIWGHTHSKNSSPNWMSSDTILVRKGSFIWVRMWKRK